MRVIIKGSAQDAQEAKQVVSWLMWLMVLVCIGSMFATLGQGQTQTQGLTVKPSPVGPSLKAKASTKTKTNTNTATATASTNTKAGAGVAAPQTPATSTASALTGDVSLFAPPVIPAADQIAYWKAHYLYQKGLADKWSQFANALQQTFNGSTQALYQETQRAEQGLRNACGSDHDLTGLDVFAPHCVEKPKK